MIGHDFIPHNAKIFAVLSRREAALSWEATENWARPLCRTSTKGIPFHILPPETYECVILGDPQKKQQQQTCGSLVVSLAVSLGDFPRGFVRGLSLWFPFNTAKKGVP